MAQLLWWLQSNTVGSSPAGGVFFSFLPFPEQVNFQQNFYNRYQICWNCKLETIDIGSFTLYFWKPFLKFNWEMSFETCHQMKMCISTYYIPCRG